ncbi:unnamed protein product [Protopolystoma xenopodis]|uniref:Uncharacterized protein n=1 Tax=Protopolystoma xenopodis TaxID=117903 RepID=A0A448WUR8_9PLAT|nr:unnamed protein product [Protopolystoma xenopodis]
MNTMGSGQGDFVYIPERTYFIWRYEVAINQVDTAAGIGLSVSGFLLSLSCIAAGRSEWYRYYPSKLHTSHGGKGGNRWTNTV